MHMNKAVLIGVTAIGLSLSGYSQTGSSPIIQPSGDGSPAAASRFQAGEPRTETSPVGDGATWTSQYPDKPHGFVSRMFRRGLEDQKELYAAPFKRSNIKWDAVVLASTGALLATDRRIERQLPGTNYQRYQN